MGNHSLLKQGIIMPFASNVIAEKIYFMEENTMEIKKTSKRILTCTLAALMLAGAAVSMPAVIPQSSLTVSAAQTYGDFEYEVKNNEVTITSYKGSGKTVTIPSTIGGKKVTAISYSTFGCCESFESISIPASVSFIEGYLFNSCSRLKEINVSQDNKNYCSFDGVLYNKDKTTLICCPCSKKNITIFNGVKKLENLSFSRCKSLTEIKIPDSVTNIGEQTFSECENLKEITIPKNVSVISNYAFFNCVNLTDINVSSANKDFTSYDGALYDKNKTTLICCPGAKTNVTLPDGVTNIPCYSFTGCPKLKSVRLPDSLKKIISFAFYNCKSLTSINIPDSITSIENNAFYNCENLKSVYIPKSVKNIGEKAFGFYNLSGSVTNDSIRKVDGFVIKGEKSSEAEKYAKENGFKFVAQIALSSVTLNKTAMSLGKGETTKLTATVAPSNAADKTVTWRTSDSKVLTVDKNGNVKAAGTGTAWITARTINGKEKSCRITVKNAPSKVTISKGTVTIGVGEKFTVGSAVPDGSAAAKRTYRTSNSSIVKMTRTDWQGDFVGVKPGTAYVTVKTYNGKESTCKVTVRSAPSSVTISKKAMTLKVGQTASLSCSVPSGSGCASRTFRTSNSSVVKMTKTNWTGSFKAVKPGVAYVTVRTYNGKESSCKITVTK